MSVTIKNILSRLSGIRVHGSKDKETLNYILDLVELYAGADSQTRVSIIKLADNYLISLESTMFNLYN